MQPLQQCGLPSCFLLPGYVLWSAGTHLAALTAGPSSLPVTCTRSCIVLACNKSFLERFTVLCIVGPEVVPVR
jgi:hypothetical protein